MPIKKYPNTRHKSTRIQTTTKPTQTYIHQTNTNTYQSQPKPISIRQTLTHTNPKPNLYPSDQH